jgi:hypothetical protein
MIDTIRTYRDIKDFDIIHLKGSRFLSFLIKLFQGFRWGKEASSYSHTAFTIWHLNELYVYEADPEVKKTLFKDWVKEKDITISRMPFNLCVRHGGSFNELKTIAKSKLGCRYDYLSLIVFQMIYILTGYWPGTRNSNSFYCSEFVAWVFYVSSNVFPDWYKINPARLYNQTKDCILWSGKAKKLV